MSHFIAMLKKEMIEGLRTYRILIMLLVFAGFGVLSPFTAKLTPDLLNSIMPEFGLTLPNPIALDSWAQFFKNISQMGLIVTVIVFSGILANELTRGTLVILLTKGLSRTAVILAKYCYMVLIWTTSLLVCFLVTLAYTVYLFPNGAVLNLAFSVICLWLFGAFLLALLLLAANLGNHSYSCLLMVGLVLVVLMIINIWPQAQQYNPLALASLNMSLLEGLTTPREMAWSIGVASTLTVVSLGAAVLLFRKKQL